MAASLTPAQRALAAYGYSSAASRGARFVHWEGRSAVISQLLWSVVVDGRWPQRRKFGAGLCALRGQEHGCLARRYFQCNGHQEEIWQRLPGPLRHAAASGELWQHASFLARDPLSTQAWRPGAMGRATKRQWRGLRGARSRCVRAGLGSCERNGSTRRPRWRAPSVHHVKGPTAVSERAGVTAERAGTQLADSICKCVSHRALHVLLQERQAASSAATCVAHWIARVCCMMQMFDIDDVRLAGVQ